MTREEALELQILTFDYFNHPIQEQMTDEMILIVNTIYDSLEKQTCCNCKHGDIVGDGGNTSALVNKCDKISFVLYDYEDFGCNKWEAKDAK